MGNSKLLKQGVMTMTQTLDVQIHAAKLELQRSDLILAAVATNHQWQNYDDHVNGLSGIYERLRSLDLLGWNVEQERSRRVIFWERICRLEAEQIVDERMATQEATIVKTFKKLFRAIKHRLRKKGLLSPVGDLDLPKMFKGYDDKLGSCLELEYTFLDSKGIQRNHVRVCMSVNSIILLAQEAVRKGGRQERVIDMAAYVSKITTNP